MYWPSVSFYTVVPSSPKFGIPTGCGNAVGCKRAGTAAKNPTVLRCFYKKYRWYSSFFRQAKKDFITALS